MEPVPSREFAAALVDLAEQCACPISLSQAEACRHYSELLLTWNLRVNLTRITAPEDLLAKHLLDAIIPTRWLPVRGRALDLGSGAGVPAIPIQIVRPELHFTLLERLRKKVSFLKVCIAQLELKNAGVVQSRWQDYAAAAAHERFDLITARALKPSPELLTRVSATRLGAGGRFALWAGPTGSEADFRKLPGPASSLKLRSIHDYRLPYQAGIRRLVVWEKLGAAGCYTG